MLLLSSRYLPPLINHPRRAGRPRLDDIMKRTNRTYRANYLEMLNIEVNQQKAGYADTGEYVREMSQYGKVYARSTPEKVIRRIVTSSVWQTTSIS